MGIKLEVFPERSQENTFVLQNRAIFNKMIVKTIAENPTVVLPTLQEVTVEECKEFLKSFHAVMWSTFSLQDGEGIEKAALWLQSTVNQLFAFVYKTQSGDDQPS